MVSNQMLPTLCAGLGSCRAALCSAHRVPSACNTSSKENPVLVSSCEPSRFTAAAFLCLLLGKWCLVMQRKGPDLTCELGAALLGSWVLQQCAMVVCGGSPR